MAVIGKIRSRSGLLIAVIGIAMLLFILGDFLTSSSTFFQNQDRTLAVINGTSISADEFGRRVEMETSMRFPNGGATASAQRSIRNSVWDNLIYEQVYLPEYREIGLGVHGKELFASIDSENPSQFLRSYYSDPNTRQLRQDMVQVTNPNRLDPAKVAQHILQLEQDGKLNEFNWVEYAMRKDLYQAKYMDLIKKGIYVTTNEANQEQLNKQKTVSFSYILQKYAAVDDATIEYNDSDLQAYWKDNNYKPEYQQNYEARSIEYISIVALPTPEDSTAIRNDLNGLVARLKESTTQTQDTNFVRQFTQQAGDIRWYSSGESYKTQGGAPEVKYLPNHIDSLVFKADSGAVVGPYLTNRGPNWPASFRDTYSIFKVSDIRYSPDSSNARHILIRIADGDTAAAKATADSLLAALSKDTSKFAAAAEDMSDDLATAAAGKGGVLGFKTQSEFQPGELATAIFKHRSGDMFIEQSPFGFHVVEVLEQTEPVKQVLGVTVDATIEPSKETLDKAFDEAGEFARNNQTEEAWQTNGAKYGIQSSDNMKQDMPNVNGIEGSREVVRWAFTDAELGEIRKEAFEIGDQFIVPRLVEIKEPGVLGLEVPTIREMVVTEVIRKKKAEQFMKDQQGVADLGQLAGKLGVVAESVVDVPVSSTNIPTLGNEYRVMGTVAGLSGPGDIAGPIEGRAGVFTIAIDKISANTETNITDVQAVQSSQRASLGSRVNFSVDAALRNKADIADNRAKFY